MYVCFDQVLAHTAGIVMFTLLVNATTMKKLLEKLGMSDISDSKKISMANAVRQIQESNQRTLTMLKADRFLADADWDMAERDCEVHNPYMEVEEGEVRRCFFHQAGLFKAQLRKPLISCRSMHKILDLSSACFH